ncbi:MAG TPA: phosphate signaling complex protein PhoU [Pseudomonadales bacterium]
MPHKHISGQFNAELDSLCSEVLALGGMVESQVLNACSALQEGDSELADEVITMDHTVNEKEKSIDEQCSQILARRHPAAGDLRLVLSIIKVIADLERIGDESKKIAHMAIVLSDWDKPKWNYTELRHLGEHVRKTLHDALDAFARMDVDLSLQVVMEDEKVDLEYESMVRQLMTLAMESPSNIQRVLHTIWAARALERVGDHAKNICEYVIYAVKGKDIRHETMEQVQKELGA